MATIRDNISYEIGPGFVLRIEELEGGSMILVSQEGEADYGTLLVEANAAGAVYREEVEPT